MSKFHGQLLYIESERDGFYVLTAPLFYESDIAKLLITVPKGAETNFVTGRKMLFVRRIVTDSMNAAAVVHDELYGSGMLPRKMADDVFYEAMLISDVTKWRAWLAYRCVRLLGSQFYKSDAQIGKAPGGASLTDQNAD
jgi:hypothetical protein